MYRYRSYVRAGLLFGPMALALSLLLVPSDLANDRKHPDARCFSGVGAQSVRHNCPENQNPFGVWP